MEDLVVIIKEDGTECPLPEPASYDGTTSTLVDSTRNSKGVVIGSVVREDVAKINLTWKYLTVEQWSYILALFTESQGGNFFNDVRFFNQATGEYEVRQMYCGDRTSGMWRRDSETGKILGWTDCKVNLIEV